MCEYDTMLNDTTTAILTCYKKVNATNGVRRYIPKYDVVEAVFFIQHLDIVIFGTQLQKCLALCQISHAQRAREGQA